MDEFKMDENFELELQNDDGTEIEPHLRVELSRIFWDGIVMKKTVDFWESINA